MREVELKYAAGRGCSPLDHGQEVAGVKDGWKDVNKRRLKLGSFFLRKNSPLTTRRMHLVVKPSHKAMFTVLPHFVEKAALTQREICRM